MEMIIKEMDERDAVEISTWVYMEPYSLYSMDGSRETIEELMDGTYYTVTNEGEVIGYFCFGKSAQVPGGRTQGLYDTENAMDIGLGLRPDLTGKGLGTEFVLKGIEFGIGRFNLGIVRLTVAAFNKRAIRVYERSGFIASGSFINKRNGEEREFIIMTRQI